MRTVTIMGIVKMRMTETHDTNITKCGNVRITKKRKSKITKKQAQDERGETRRQSVMGFERGREPEAIVCFRGLRLGGL